MGQELSCPFPYGISQGKNMEKLAELFPGETFEPVKKDLLKEAKNHLDNLAKPVDSLGKLENIAMRLYAIGNGRLPIRIDPALLYTVAGDHGVALQGASQFPQAATRQIVNNLLAGGASVNVLCRASRISQKIVDAGCVQGSFKAHPLLVDLHLGHGTEDISQGPAMNIETCIAALRAGLALALGAAQNGFACVATGGLGVGGTTAAAALYCAFLEIDPDDLTFPEASGALAAHKRKIISKALNVNAEALASDNPVQILASLGGFELAILAGLMLGCASQSLPFIVDGFTCAAAYAAACAMFTHLPDYAFLSHLSAEPGFQKVLEKLSPGYKPLLDLEMRLGDGSGAALALPLLRSAAAIFNEMATHESAGL